jgi:hypothetical protein
MELLTQQGQVALSPVGVKAILVTTLGSEFLGRLPSVGSGTYATN